MKGIMMMKQKLILLVGVCVVCLFAGPALADKHKEGHEERREKNRHRQVELLEKLLGDQFLPEHHTWTSEQLKDEIKKVRKDNKLHRLVKAARKFSPEDRKRLIALMQLQVLIPAEFEKGAPHMFSSLPELLEELDGFGYDCASEWAAEPDSPQQPLSYAMPNGDTGYWKCADLDGLYNGSGDPTVAGSYLAGGLGQLTDGIWDDIPAGGYIETWEEGEVWVGWDTNIPAEPYPCPSSGYGREVVRYADPEDARSIPIIFDFGTSVNLSSVSVHCNNQGNGAVVLYESVEIEFSDDGENWHNSSLFVPSAEERAVSGARFIEVPVSGEGQFCRLTFVTGAGANGPRWLHLDEIAFVGN